MQTFGAALTGNQRTLPRTQLLRQLRRNTGRGPPSAARQTRRDQARHRDPDRPGSPGSGSRCPVEALEARLSGLPAGVSVEPGRIEVRFSGAQDAVGRLFALAQALTHDYEQFEALVDGATPGAAGER